MCQVPICTEQPIHTATKLLHQIPIGDFFASPQIVNSARLAFLDGQTNAAGVIPHMNPVSLVESIAVQGNGLILQDALDGFGNQLFRILIGAIIIRAAGDDHIQPVGIMEGQYHGVRCRLAGRVGITGTTGTVFGKRHALA